MKEWLKITLKVISLNGVYHLLLIPQNGMLQGLGYNIIITPKHSQTCGEHGLCSNLYMDIYIEAGAHRLNDTMYNKAPSVVVHPLYWNHQLFWLLTSHLDIADASNSLLGTILTLECSSQEGSITCNV